MEKLVNHDTVLHALAGLEVEHLVGPAAGAAQLGAAVSAGTGRAAGSCCDHHVVARVVAGDLLELDAVAPHAVGDAYAKTPSLV